MLRACLHPLKNSIPPQFKIPRKKPGGVISKIQKSLRVTRPVTRRGFCI